MFRNRKTNVFPKMLSEKIYHRKHILPFSMLNRCSVIYSIKSSLHMCLLCDMVRKYAWTGVTFVYLPSNKKNGCVEFNRRHKMCAPEVIWRCNLCVKSDPERVSEYREILTNPDISETSSVDICLQVCI